MPALEIKDLHKHIPRSWFNALHRCEFWVTGFRILTTKDRQVERGRYYDFDAETRIMIWFGTVVHLVPDGEPSAAFQHADGRAEIKWNPSKPASHDNANWLLIFQRYRSDQQYANTKCIDRGHTLAGLVAATIGDNWVYVRRPWCMAAGTHHEHGSGRTRHHRQLLDLGRYVARATYCCQGGLRQAQNDG